MRSLEALLAEDAHNVLADLTVEHGASGAVRYGGCLVAHIGPTGLVPGNKWRTHRSRVATAAAAELGLPQAHALAPVLHEIEHGATNGLQACLRARTALIQPDPDPDPQDP